MMRLVYLPVITTREKVFKESDFVVAYDLARNWKAFTHIIVNEAAIIPESYHSPNIEYLPLAEWFPLPVSQGLACERMYKMFNPIDGEIQVDAIVTSRTATAGNLRRMFWYDQEVQVPIFIIEPKVCDFGATHDYVSEIDVKMRSMSYTECPTFFSTEREKSVACRAASRYLSGSSCKQMLDNAIVRSQGFPSLRLRELAKNTPKDEQFTLLFAARFNSNKRWKTALDILQTYFRTGKNVKIKAIGWSGLVSQEDLKKFDAVEFIEPLPYADYLELICRSHISLSASDEEGFAIGWAEQVCSGNPVVLPRNTWATTMFKGYPEYLFYDNMTQALALLKHVQKNYQEVRDEVDSFCNEFAPKHDLSVVAKDMEQVIEEKCAGTYSVFDEFRGKLDKTLAEMPDRFTLNEFLDKVRKMWKVSIGLYVRAFSISSKRNFYRYLCETCDTVLEPTQFFVKRGR